MNFSILSLVGFLLGITQHVCNGNKFLSDCIIRTTVSLPPLKENLMATVVFVTNSLFTLATRKLRHNFQTNVNNYRRLLACISLFCLTLCFSIYGANDMFTSLYFTLYLCIYLFIIYFLISKYLIAKNANHNYF